MPGFYQKLFGPKIVPKGKEEEALEKSSMTGAGPRRDDKLKKAEYKALGIKKGDHYDHR